MKQQLTRVMSSSLWSHGSEAVRVLVDTLNQEAANLGPLGGSWGGSQAPAAPANVPLSKTLSSKLVQTLQGPPPSKNMDEGFPSHFFHIWRPKQQRIVLPTSIINT